MEPAVPGRETARATNRRRESMALRYALCAALVVASFLITVPLVSAASEGDENRVVAVAKTDAMVQDCLQRYSPASYDVISVVTLEMYGDFAGEGSFYRVDFYAGPKCPQGQICPAGPIVQVATATVSSSFDVLSASCGGTTTQ
jgi:hypothetical protein